MGRYPSVIRQGSSGDDVKWLQSLLNDRLESSEDGFAYVGAAYIKDGVVTSGTLTVRSGMSTSSKEVGKLKNGDKVYVCSTMGAWSKIKYGSPKLKISGVADSDTISKLKEFQKQNKLVSDGVCGDKTWAVLLPDAVYYRQNGMSYSGLPYTSTGNKSQTIGSSGCGVVSMAMAVASLTKKAVDIVKLADIAVKNGFRTANSGTSWGFFQFAAKMFGLKCKQTSSFDEMVKALDGGAFVVASMGVGYYTRGGHYILVWARNPFSKTIYTLDPASANRPSCSDALMKRESKQYFIIQK